VCAVVSISSAAKKVPTRVKRAQEKEAQLKQFLNDDENFCDACRRCLSWVTPSLLWQFIHVVWSLDIADARMKAMYCGDCDKDLCLTCSIDMHKVIMVLVHAEPGIQLIFNVLLTEREEPQA